MQTGQNEKKENKYGENIFLICPDISLHFALWTFFCLHHLHRSSFLAYIQLKLNYLLKAPPDERCRCRLPYLNLKISFAFCIKRRDLMELMMMDSERS